MIKDKSRISTSSHEDIQSWATSTQMRPTRIKRFKSETILDRLKFRYPHEKYPNEEDLEWGTFFDIFDQENLEFVFEDIADEAIENRNSNIYELRPRKAY